MPRCSLCGGRGEVYQPQSDRVLCRSCFIKDVKSRVLDQLSRYSMIGERDTVLLAVSGGKDSFVLIDVLSEIHDPGKLVALTVVEGMPGYNRADEIKRLAALCRSRGIRYVVTTFKSEVGYSLEELVSLAEVKGLTISPCTLCGVLKRRVVNVVARRLGAARTATAHNLDDEAQTLIVNVLRGDVSRIIRLYPGAPKPHKLFVHRVRPLRKVYEWETTLYAFYKGFSFQRGECPYITRRPTLRARVRRFLYEYEHAHPGSLMRMVEMFDEALDRLKPWRSLPELPVCERCGEPTSYGRRLCKVCELLEELGVA